MNYVEVLGENLTVKQLRYLAYCPSRKHLSSDKYLEFVKLLKDMPNVFSDEEIECIFQLPEVSFNCHQGFWRVTYDNGTVKCTVASEDKDYATIWSIIDAHHKPGDDGSYWVPELLC